MILVDFSGAFYAAAFVELNRNGGVSTDIDYLRKIMINQLTSYQRKFSDEYGELIVCLDSKKINWRRERFPGYKQKRREGREISNIDWSRVFADIATITNEFKENLPYKFIQIDRLEADDIIALATKNIDRINTSFNDNPLGINDEKILIISNDKDFRQLHKYPYVRQYFPQKSIVIKEQNPERELIELILKGDPADGVPNIRSDINTFITENVRQKPVTGKFIHEFLTNGISALTENEQQRYIQNEELISFEKIPEEFNDIVVNEINNYKMKANKFNTFMYCTNHGLIDLANNLDKIFTNK